MMQYKFTVNKLSDRKELGRVAAQEAAEAISALLKEGDHQRYLCCGSLSE